MSVANETPRTGISAKADNSRVPPLYAFREETKII